MTLWRRVMAERKDWVWPLLIGLAVNLAVLALGVFPLQASVASDENRATAVKCSWQKRSACSDRRTRLARARCAPIRI